VVRQRFQSQKSTRDRLTEDCGVKAIVAGIVLDVGAADSFIVIAGQDAAVGLKGQEVILTARTNGKPSKYFC
jgi:hypothetical protein